MIFGTFSSAAILTLTESPKDLVGHPDLVDRAPEAKGSSDAGTHAIAASSSSYDADSYIVCTA